jgi:hypothetical protein
VEAVSGSGKLHKYLVETERGTNLKPNDVARVVADVLNDPRGWAGDGKIRFSLIKDRSKTGFVVSLVTAATAGKACGKELVCKKGAKLVIAATAWAKAPSAFSNIDDYRAYLVNYAVGVYQGQKTAQCPGKGKPAQVMQQQWNHLGGCTANPWVN